MKVFEQIIAKLPFLMYRIQSQVHFFNNDINFLDFYAAFFLYFCFSLSL